jgi:hypothetical protein
MASIFLNLAFSDKRLREACSSAAATLWGKPMTDDTGAHVEDSGEDNSDDNSDDDEDEIFIFQPPFPARPRLDPDSPLAQHREVILETATQRFSEFKLGKPQLSQRPKNLPCPFYANDPRRHRECLRLDLQRPVDLKRHLWTSHRQLQHGCPICGSAFDTATACDVHIRQRECKQRVEVPRPEGLSDAQLYQLAEATCEEEVDENYKAGKSTKSEQASWKAEWTAIWNIALPRDTTSPGYPDDLNNTTMDELELLRGFWRRQGREITAGLLAERGVDVTTMGSPKGRRDIRALQASILDAMVEHVLASMG